MKRFENSPSQWPFARALTSGIGPLENESLTQRGTCGPSSCSANMQRKKKNKRKMSGNEILGKNILLRKQRSC